MASSLNTTPSNNGAPGTGLPPAPAPTPIPADDTSTTTTSSSTVLDDHDKVEKKWVDKAKKIIRQTHSDPYRQNQELTILKADYMKQHYNKIIKVDK